MPTHELDPEDLTSAQRVVLQPIGWYYNGVWIRWEGTIHQLGETRPPNIEHLVRVFLQNVEGLEDRWGEVYQPAYERLVTDGWLQNSQICRKPIQWAPSKAARQVLDDLLTTDDLWAEAVPSCYNYDGGLVGDRNESLKHRWGIEVARHVLPEKRFSDLEFYPGDGSAQRFDIHAIRDGSAWAIDVLCEHHSKKAYAKKYRQAAATNRFVYYIFQGTTLANEVLNHWTENADLECDIVNYPLDPEQRAIKKARSYVRRSASSDHPTPGINRIETIQRLYDHTLADAAD